MKPKKLLKAFVLVTWLLCSMSAVAAEAYAVYTANDRTLSFYYDDLRSSRTGTTYSLNTGNSKPDWYNDGNYMNVRFVEFFPSFANARPTSTAYWFYGMNQLLAISSQYLNTSNVTNMSNMFSGCTQLTSLVVNNFNTAKVTNMSNMFCDCQALRYVDVSNF